MRKLKLHGVKGHFRLKPRSAYRALILYPFTYTVLPKNDEAKISLSLANEDWSVYYLWLLL